MLSGSVKAPPSLRPREHNQKKGLRSFLRSPYGWVRKLFRFPHCCPQVTEALEWSHGVTGTTGPPLLIASMQFLSISWATRVGFPATVFPSIASWSHAVVIRLFTVMLEHR